MKRTMKTKAFAQGNVYWRVPYVEVVVEGEQVEYENFAQLN